MLYCLYGDGEKQLLLCGTGITPVEELYHTRQLRFRSLPIRARVKVI